MYDIVVIVENGVCNIYGKGYKKVAIFNVDETEKLGLLTSSDIDGIKNHLMNIVENENLNDWDESTTSL